MTATLSSELRKNRTIEERLQIFTDTDDFRELMRQYSKYRQFSYRVIRENRAEIICKEDSIDVRMIPRPFNHSYRVATIEIESDGDFEIMMYSDPEQSQLEIDLFMQDLRKILQ